MPPISKDGFQFSFEEDGLQIARPDTRELYLSFTDQLKLSQNPWTGSLKVKGRGGSASLAFLPPAEQKSFVLEFFRRWRLRNPEAAKKAAFDYVDGQKGFVALAFVASLLVSVPVGVGLLADSRDQFHCTRVLHESSTLTTMQVTKFKKKRKGHYLLDLQFTTPEGLVVRGHDQLILPGQNVDESTIPKSVPVVYSPVEPNCWSLTPNLTGSEVNWAKLRYFGYFTAMFGSFFLAMGVAGICWCLGRWRRPRPFKAELKEMFQL